MSYELVETLIQAIQRRLSSETEEAQVQRIGKSVIITSKRSPEYTPDFRIRDIEKFNLILERYLSAVHNTDTKYVEIDDRHGDRYFLFNVWINATQSDFQHPDDFIIRYTNFIQDTTFKEYDESTHVGLLRDNEVWIQRRQEEHGLETPYVMRIVIRNGEEEHLLPEIRYGISTDEHGERTAYIYGIQGKKEPIISSYDKYVNEAIKRMKKSKTQRNVNPRHVFAMSIFMGMLAKEGITNIETPDFLVGRYGRFLDVAKTEEQMDYVQKNLTERFFGTFARLSEHFQNLKLENFNPDTHNFLRMKLDPQLICDCDVLRAGYLVGLGGEKNYNDREDVDNSYGEI